MARKYHGLAALQDDAISVGSAGVGALAGVAVARWVVDDLVMPAAAPAGKEAFPGAKALVALIPAAVGLGIQYLSPQVPAGAARDATTGVAAGMVAYSLGKLIGALMPATTDAATRKFVPFAGMNQYDYSLGYNSPEFGPGSVSAYMNGLGDAPITTELVRSMNGAIVDIQPVTPFNGAPVSIAPASASMYAPMATALTA